MHASERDDDTISQLTSKLPTPPPRPSSIASSSRTSRRSSNASSMIRQPRLYETEPVPAPPPPNSSWVATRKCKSSLEIDGPTITIGMLPSAKPPQRPPARKRVSTFAEQFKSLVCTSALLNSTLSIAAYEKATADPWTPVTLAPPSEANVAADIRSIPSLREVSSMVWLDDVDVEAAKSTAARPGVHMSDSATTLVHGFVLACALLYPISENRELWKRAVLILASIVWAVVAVFGTETNVAVYFEITHKPTGSYRPSNFDQTLRASKDGGVASSQLNRRKQERIHNLACAKVAQLIQDCRTFDVECNKALNAIQETELVSRGYKLSHPLAPISRIELSANTARSTRVVPHSAPATGAGSTWGHRPVSLTATAAAAMGHSPRLSWSTWQQQPSIEPEEDVRLLRLRKALSSTLEGAQQKFKSATDNLKPFVDDEEMKLLCEVYDLDSSRASSLVDEDSNDSSSQLRTSSWASRSCAPASDSTRLSSSPTIDEGGSSPVTLVNRNSLFIDASTLGDKYGSLRKRDSGPWDAQAGPSPMRAGSRLSYISDKSPLSGTANGPSNNVAMKRLSYGSSGSGGGGLASLSYRTSLQSAQRSGSQSRRLSNLAAQPSLQDLSRPTSPTDAISAPSPVIESTKIIALKTSFETMHYARRRLLCSLLALDFSLRRTVGLKLCTTKSTMRYWLAVGQEMTLLSNTLRRSADDIKRDVHRDLSVKTLEGTKAAAGDATQPSSGVEATPADDKEVDYSGFEDRLMAMGEVLRSVQIKMRLCATDLSKRKPAPLHGELDATDGEEHLRQKILEQNKSLMQQGRADAEVMFSTIREDLLTLSAEWETALKIMRVQGLAQVSNASASAKSTNDNSYASVDNSAGIGGLDSPQEADEDALREWVRSRTGGGEEGDLSVSSDIDVEIKELIERKLAEDEGKGDGKGDGMSPGVGVGDGRGNGKQTNEGAGQGRGDGKGEEDLATLLLRSTSPQHLPPPGVEQVYEDIATPKPRVSAVPRSREERIRATKLERAAKLAGATKEAAGPPSTSGVIQELQAVMKTRREATVDRVIPLGNSARHNKWGPERV